MQPENPKPAMDEFRRLDLKSHSWLPDATSILLLSIPVALGLGILIGHAFPADMTWLLPK